VARFLIATRDSDDAVAAANSSSHECTVIAGSVNCASVWNYVYRGRTQGLWGFAALRAAFWLALALIAFAAVYGSFRWVLAGRKKRASPERDG
jgi:hypothetical protein